MRKASDFLSKPVISLKEGKNEGIIKNISFDIKLKAAEWLVLYDENDADCDEKAVKLDDSYTLGENAVMIKSGKAVIPAVSAPLNDNNPINCRIYTSAGKLDGIVSDVHLTDENAVTELIYGKDKVLPLRDVLSSSRDVVVSAENKVSVEALEVPEKKVPAPRPADKKRKVKALKPKAEKDKETLIGEIKELIKEINSEDVIIFEERKAEKVKTEEIKVDDIKIEEATVEEVKKNELGVAVPFRSPPERSSPPTVNPAIPALISYALIKGVTPLADGRDDNLEIWPHQLDHIPERIIANYGFLLGRRVGKNIYNSSRQIIIRADTVVNPYIVETARKYGRLIDLTKLSL